MKKRLASEQSSRVKEVRKLALVWVLAYGGRGVGTVAVTSRPDSYWRTESSEPSKLAIWQQPTVKSAPNLGIRR
jgi:hypothetical protein